MTIIISNDIPEQVRGCLKTWFIEPKTNVFVSNVNNRLAERIVKFLCSQCKNIPGFIIIQSTNTGLGYKIINVGKPTKTSFNLSGLDLF